MFEDTAKKKVSNFRRKFMSSWYVLQNIMEQISIILTKPKKEQIYSLSDIWKTSYFPFTKKALFSCL